MKGLSIAAIALAFGAGCYYVPKPIREYAAGQPKRADGQYLALPEDLREQLIEKDASVQCSIDLVDKEKEDKSAACTCLKAGPETFRDKCSAWLGAHMPAVENTAPPTSEGSATTDSGSATGEQ